MATREVSTKECLQLAVDKTIALIHIVESLPETKKVCTTLRYLRTSLVNLTHMLELAS